MHQIAVVVRLNRDLEMKVMPVKMTACRTSGMNPPWRMLWSHLKRVWVRHRARQAKSLLGVNPARQGWTRRPVTLLEVVPRQAPTLVIPDPGAELMTAGRPAPGLQQVHVPFKIERHTGKQHPMGHVDEMGGDVGDTVSLNGEVKIPGRTDQGLIVDEFIKVVNTFLEHRRASVGIDPDPTEYVFFSH